MDADVDQIRMLRLFEDEAHDISLREQFRNSIAVLGMTRMGKSNTVARLFEQLAGYGVPGVIVDISNEYWGLKQKYGVIIAGSNSAHTDIIITDPAQAAALAVWSLREGVSVILSLRNYKPDMRYEVVNAYLEALWKEEGYLRRNYKIFLEEARNWAPQQGKAPTSDILTTIATEGLKDGLSLVVIGLRPAQIDKNILTQCGIVILHRLWMANDLNVFNDTFGRTKWLRQKVIELKPGDAIISRDSGVAEVRVLRRETFHAGYTPGVDTAVDEAPPLTELSPEMLLSLRDMLAVSPKAAPSRDREAELIKENQQYLRQIETLESEVERLGEEVERLSKLSVHMPDTLTVETMTVSQVMAAPTTPSVILAPETPPSQITAAASYSNKGGVTLQDRRFSKILSRVQSSIPMHKAVLSYLLHHPDQEVSRSELARRTGYNETTLRGRPFRHLINEGLIQRTLHRSWVRFRATDTRAYLIEQFPLLDADVMIQRLMAACAQ